MPETARVEFLGFAEGVRGAVMFHRARTGRGPYHRHIELEANLVLSGHATYLVGENRFRLSRRTMIWLFPAQNHLLFDQSSDFSMQIMVWTPELLELSCQAPTSQILRAQNVDGTWIRRLYEDDVDQLNALCRHVVASRGDEANAGLAYLLFRSWGAFQRSEAEVLGGAVHPAVERAARLLREHNPPPAVEKLSRQVGLSPGRLSRLFKLQTGIPLAHFRLLQCLERAQRLAQDPDLPWSEVAERAGFGSYSHFHRAWKAHTGQSPRQALRRQAQSTEAH
ncbi:hypothetical protein IAD21_00127 [Abditibacteriota bacterium]|nr:hypothetical protein IAD21_00127 [Abditibacteriota bacterium]